MSNVLKSITPPNPAPGHIRFVHFADTTMFVDILSTSPSFTVNGIKSQLINLHLTNKPVNWETGRDWTQSANIRLFADYGWMADLVDGHDARGSSVGFYDYNNIFIRVDDYQKIHYEGMAPYVPFFSTYYSNDIKELSVTGFKDTIITTVNNWTESLSSANGTYKIANNNLGYYWTNDINPPDGLNYYNYFQFLNSYNGTLSSGTFTNMPAKKLHWVKYPTYAGQNQGFDQSFHTISWERAYNSAGGSRLSGRYVLSRHYDKFGPDSNHYNDTHRSVVLARSESIHTWDYNEDIIDAKNIKWVPVNFSYGTGGYIEVNSVSNPVTPNPKPKTVRFGGKVTVTKGGGIKFKTI